MSTFAKSGVTTYLKTSSSSSVVGGDGHGRNPTDGKETHSDSILLPAAILILSMTICVVALGCWCCPPSPVKELLQPPPVKQTSTLEALEHDQLVKEEGYTHNERTSVLQEARNSISRVSLSMSNAMMGRSWQNLQMPSQ